MRKRSRQSSKNFSSACSKRSADRLAATPITKNDQGEVVGLGLAEFQLQPGDAAIIGELPELSRLSLQRSNVKDEDLQAVQRAEETDRLESLGRKDRRCRRRGSHRAERATESAARRDGNHR